MAFLWPWLAKFGAPIALAFLLGVFVEKWQDAERDADALVKASQDAATRIETSAGEVAAILKSRVEAQEERQIDYAKVESIVRRNRAPIGDCPASARDVERMRRKVDAVNRFTASDVPSRSDNFESADGTSGTDPASPD